MPNNKQGSGHSNQDMSREGQGAQGGYGNTSREAGGSRQDREPNQRQQGSDSQSGGRSTGGQTGNDDEM